MSKFFLAALILLASLALQFATHWDLAIAALIAFACILDWREVLPLALFGALIVNWQPTFSLSIIMFVAFPLFVYVLRTMVPYEPLVGAPLAVALVTIMLAATSGIGIDAIGTRPVIIDAVVSAIWSIAVLSATRN